MAVYRFGPFRLDPVRRLLTREDEPVPLPAKAFDLLLVLVQHSGAALQKAELLRKVWPDARVEEGNLSQTVFVLRKALGERPNEHRYVVTIPGFGYRFVTPVTWDRGSGFEELRSDPRAIGARGALLSLAVLPFTILGVAADEEYIGLGITDALITKLGSVRGVTVRPTTAVLRYHQRPPDPLAAASELNVDVVLNGTIQRSGGRIRVAVHVVRGDDGAMLWAGQFDEKLADLFAMEDSIADQVAGALTLTLTEQDRQRLARRNTENTDAYHAFLKGRFFWNKRTEEGLRKGVGQFEEAIAHDPQYALAYAGIADCYNLLCGYGALPPREGYPRARQAAERALELDEGLAEAHTSVAYAGLHFYWDWSAAEREFGRALSLNANYATAHQWYGSYLAALGRFEDAIAEIEHALKLDPLSLMINADRGWLLFFARQYDRAIDQLRKTIEMEPNFPLAHWLLGMSREQLGQIEEAVPAFRKAVSLSQDIPFALASLGHALARSGNRDEAHAVLGQLSDLSDRRYVSPHSVATVHVGLGRTSEALEWLNRAADERSNWMIFLNVDPVFDPLRSEPEFEQIIRRVMSRAAESLR
jgi:DNA-binding winged helix-turn-helix (wHTH) protein/tetratricopeptide (TPR) repeat protein